MKESEGTTFAFQVFICLSGYSAEAECAQMKHAGASDAILCGSIISSDVQYNYNALLCTDMHLFAVLDHGQTR